MLLNNSLKFIINIIIALVFLVGAISKLISIDSFEIYVYSFGILKLDYVFFLARLIISLELIIGILLIVGKYTRFAMVASIAMLSAFCTFIFFLILTRNSEHCHCFGDIEMSHTTSLFKNILLIALLLVSYKRNCNKFKYDKLVFLIIVIFSVSLPLIVSPPDSLFYTKYSKSVAYNDFMLSEYLKENSQYTQGRKMICFFSTECRFCKLAAKKILVIAKKANNTEAVNFVFSGSQDSVDKFLIETKATIFKYTFIPPNRFLKITNGEMPLIILLEDGNVKGKYGYRNINEHEIMGFMRSEK